jgi:hypothetical protein
MYGAGQLELEIPDFVNVNQDPETRQVRLTVADRNERRQREMWGMQAHSNYAIRIAQAER